jgi:hypothetical protein
MKRLSIKESAAEIKDPAGEIQTPANDPMSGDDEDGYFWDS